MAPQIVGGEALASISSNELKLRQTKMATVFVNKCSWINNEEKDNLLRRSQRQNNYISQWHKNMESHGKTTTLITTLIFLKNFLEKATVDKITQHKI